MTKTLLFSAAVVPGGQIAASSALALGTGPIASAEGNAGAILGVADVLGNGPYDLFLGIETLVPYATHDTNGVPIYGPSVSLAPVEFLDPLANDAGLVLSIPFAQPDAYHARIAVAAGRMHTFETNDHVSLDVLFNDGSFVTLGSFRGNVQGASGALALDQDGDGVGDETPLDVAFRSYTFPIPEGEWPISLRVRVDVDENEEVGIDGIELIAVHGNATHVVARSGFDDVDGEWTFETNIDASAINGLTATYRGATFAGDGFNDFFAVHPYTPDLFSPINLDLGFNNWDGTGFIIAEDTSRDGLPTEVFVTFAPVGEPVLPLAFSRRKSTLSTAFVDGSTSAQGGGLQLEPNGESVGFKVSTTAPTPVITQTWMAWVKVDSFEVDAFTATHPHGIINSYAGTSMDGVLRLFSGRVQAGWFEGTRFVLSTTDYVIPTGEWLHIATASDGINAPLIYVNGTEWNATVSLGDSSSRPLAASEYRIGYQALSGNRRILDGAIRDVRIYDRTLSPFDISAVAQAGPTIVAMADTRDVRPGALVTMPDDRLVALASQGNALLAFQYDHEGQRFAQISRLSLPHIMRVHALAAAASAGEAINMHLSTHGVADYLPFGNPLYSPDFIPYDGAGIWLGGMPEDDVYFARLSLVPEPQLEESPIRVSNTAGRVLFESKGLTKARPAAQDGLLSGGVLGTVLFHPITTAGDPLADQQYVWLDTGALLLHPTPSARPIALSQPGDGSDTDMILQSDGGIYFYKSTGTESAKGGPIFKSPVRLLQEGAILSFGRSAAITGADLDGNGLVDLIAGNAAGQLLISRQTAPFHFSAPDPMNVNGREYRYEAGYRGSLQGPAQSRLGHTSPTLFDWNGNGFHDILLSNISGDYFVMLRDTSSAGIAFHRPRPLYMDGLEFHTTWRNQPAVSDWNGTSVPTLVTFDRDDKLRMYRQYDAFNLLEGELLTLHDDSEITGNIFASSGTGRIRLQLVDWDEDGVVDLIVGTTPESAVPTPATGLPYASASVQGSAILFLRNVASNTAPKFAEPEVVDLNGKSLAFESETTSPFVAGGGNDPLGLLVAPASGIVHFWSLEVDGNGFDRFFIH